MTVKTSISLTDQMHEKAMQLVQAGAYPHLSALVQQAMRELLAAEAEREARLQALRGELAIRAEGEFLDAGEFEEATDQMFAELLATPSAS